MPLKFPDVWGIKKEWPPKYEPVLKTGDLVEIVDISPHSGYYTTREVYIGKRGVIDLDHNGDVIKLSQIGRAHV